MRSWIEPMDVREWKGSKEPEPEVDGLDGTRIGAMHGQMQCNSLKELIAPSSKHLRRIRQASWGRNGENQWHHQGPRYLVQQHEKTAGAVRRRAVARKQAVARRAASPKSDGSPKASGSAQDQQVRRQTEVRRANRPKGKRECAGREAEGERQLASKRQRAGPLPRSSNRGAEWSAEEASNRLPACQSEPVAQSAERLACHGWIGIERQPGIAR